MVEGVSIIFFGGMFLEGMEIVVVLFLFLRGIKIRVRESYWNKKEGV